MSDETVTQYTLRQRRLRERLTAVRSLADLKAWLDEVVVGTPAVVSDFRQRTLDERKDEMRGQAREQFQGALASGFDDGSGTVWAATEDARARVLDLTQRIQEHRAGKAASALPNGKSTVKLRDAGNTPHDVGPDKIVALAEQGSDFKDKAEDRLEELLASIDAATSHADLDAIDVTAGWP